MAAGTAMYDGLAAKIANRNWLPIESVIRGLIAAIIQPLTNGVTMAKTAVKMPFFKNAANFFPLVIPMSTKILL